MTSKRRGVREGSIYQTKDKRWVGALSLGYRGGKRLRKRFYGATRREVQAQLVKAQRDVQLQLPVRAERQTVSQYLDYWLSHIVKQTLRPRTYASYVHVVERHLDPELGRCSLERLGVQHVQSMMTSKRASGLSVRSVLYMRAVLRSALEQALRMGLVARNVAKLVTPPKAQRFEPRFLTPDEAKRFLAAARDDRLDALYTVALAMGLRVGEALGLKWDDVDFAAGVLRIRRSLQPITKKTAAAMGIQAGLILVDTKTDRSRRTLRVPVQVTDALVRHRKRQLEERLKAGSRWEDSGLVFTSSFGGPMDSSNVRLRFTCVTKAAGIVGLRLHDLRHTCASLLHAQGVDARTIMEVLGHSQISVTLNTYTHVLDVAKSEAARSMEAILS